jgi:hypothetical protein
MANRRDYFFRQRVTEAELDDGFAELEKADQNLAAELGFTGVLANAVVSQHAPVPDLSADVSGPGAVLDQLGQRIFFSALQNVNVAQDDGGVSTSVSASGQEKIVTVFVKFDRGLSDPRVDGNSLTVFFRRDESFRFIVAQGAQAPAGTALPPPLRSDAILLADVTRSFGQTQVLNANISTARRQDALVAGGSPRSIRRGKTLEAVSDLLTFLNAHVSGTSDRHPAAAIDYAGGGAWADGTTNPAASVEAQFDKVVADLAAAGGAPKVGAAATAGAPNSLGAGTVRSQLDALLGFINAHINLASGAHAASALTYAGGGNWADGTTNPATTVEGELDKIISDLAATSGAPKVGAAATAGSPNALVAGTVRSQLDALVGFINAHINLAAGAHAASALTYAGGGNWADGTTNPATTVEGQLDKIVSDLVATAAAARIGAAASGNLPAGTVRSQLDALDATSVRTNVANTFTALQTLNGAAGDTNGAMATTVAPTTRKLLWEIQAGGAMKVRFYAGLDGGWEVTCNARWDGAQWVRDTSGNNSSMLRMDRFNFTLNRKIPSGNFADGTWDGSWDINIPANGANSWNTDDWFGNGQTTSYAAVQATESDNGNLGAGCTWKHRFSATPSSITFATQSMIGVSSGPFSFAASEIGTGVFVGGAAGTTWFYTHVTAS